MCLLLLLIPANFDHCGTAWCIKEAERFLVEHTSTPREESHYSDPSSLHCIAPGDLLPGKRAWDPSSRHGPSCAAPLVAVLLVTTTTSCKGAGGLDEQEASLFVDSSKSRQILQTLFGIFFEEINHAGAGGLWTELVSNRGFEALVNNTPTIEPWSIIGDESSLHVTADRVSCFTKNTVALRMEVLCDNCPPGGVGLYNPGFWGMNIEEGKTYNLVMYIRSSDSVDLTASLTCSKPSGVLQNLASASTQYTSFP